MPILHTGRRYGLVVLVVLLVGLTWPLAARAALPVPQVEATSTQELASGVTWQSLAGVTASGDPLVVNVLRVNPAASLVEVRVAPAAGGGETLSSLAGRQAAVGGVNGGFFAGSGGRLLPLGNVIVDGQVEAVNDMLRTTVGIDGRGKLLTGYLNPQVTWQPAPEEALEIAQVNWPYQGRGVYLYTPVWGKSTGSPPGTLEVIVSQGKVAGTGFGNVIIPRDGYVLSGVPGGYLPPLGAPVELDYGLPSAWEGVAHALTAGPLLVEEGEPVFQGVMEGFTGTVLGRAARTAIGADAAGDILLVTVDRRAGYSAGLTLEEMALLMMKLGAETAVGLDGGGSTAMWAGDKIVNQPADGRERKLANAILVLAQIPVYLDGERLFFDVPPLLEKGRTLVPLRGIFEALGADVYWDEALQQVRAAKGEREVLLTVGDTTAYVQGQPLTLEVAPRVVRGRTLVPLRLVSEALGAAVQWEKDTATVYITTRSERGRNP